MRERELEVVGVVTQPDRPAGRGKALTPCPCKAFASEQGVAEIITPVDVNSDEALAKIREWNPDVIAVVAFGQFLKAPLLNLPIAGCINCHFSLLPKYRGASPVVSALAAGEKLTGVSVMRMGLGMDDGPVLLQSYEPIYSDVTGGELMDSLAITGGVTLAKALKLINRNALPPEVKQNDDSYEFTVEITAPGDDFEDSLKSALNNKLNTNAIQQIVTRLMQEGKITATSTQKEISDALMPELLKLIEDVIDDIEIETETTENTLVVYETEDGEVLIDAKKSDLD
jgi:methionyl-tRNA formyltransferase